MYIFKHGQSIWFCEGIIIVLVVIICTSLVAQMVVCLQHRRPRFDPWVGKIPWRRAWQPSPVFLLGESPWTEEPCGLQSMGSQSVGHSY